MNLPQNAKFELICPHVKNKKVLDLGVVQHDVTREKDEDWLHGLIRDVSSECIGIDINEDGVSELSKRGYNVRVADATDFEMDERFEVVVAGDIIEHLADFEGFLESVKQHIEPSGIFIITTPNVYFFRRWLLTLLNGEAPVNPQHTCWFDAVTLKQLLNRYGFELESLDYTSGELLYRRFLPLPERLRNTTIVAVCSIK